MRLSAAETDTIAAIATPPGEGGLAVLRISGAHAVAVADRLFRPAGRGTPMPSQASSHTVHYGRVHLDGRDLDEVLLTVFRAPRTFTREDVVEISCHGGSFVARQVLDAALAAGARLATPGEFTRRAFLNGRLDLTQAEAVADLIHARTELALAAAQDQLHGGLSRRLNPLRDDLLVALAHLEAHLDFPDEDIAPDTREGLLRRFTDAAVRLDELLATAREGQVLRRGLRVAILGRPNAGKSSLLNRLLGRERAIVSPVAGTTRDTIEETANLRGIPVQFVDTAGLRESEDALEQEGIRRTREAARHAELLLLVLDASSPLTGLDQSYLDGLVDRPCLVVLNKSDLPAHPDFRLPGTTGQPPVPISCATGAGIEALKSAIARQVLGGALKAGLPEAAISARHEDALRRARASLDHATGALQGNEPLELVALELRLAVSAVGEVVGKTTTEDLLDRIFSEFCLGK